MVFPNVLKITVLMESGEKENFLLTLNRYSSEDCRNLDCLKQEVVARYPGLLQFEDIRYYWIDEEGDEIIILNNFEYYDFMNACNPESLKRRIYVKGINKTPATKSSKSQEAPMEQDTVPKTDSIPTETVLPVHTNIVCDVCDETIRGHRYKCMQCFNYDLCMRCENRFRHKDHMMVRIPNPELNRRAPFRLFEKLRSFATDIGSQPGFAAAHDVREDEYENSKRSKRHHRRHSRDRDESKECREEKEKKERKQRRERCAKSSEEQRAGHRQRFGHAFKFSHLINQVIDPANIQSAFVSADAAAAAAAAAAESAEEAVRVSMANCPLFANVATAHNATASASGCTSTAASAPAPQPEVETDNKTSPGDEPQQASVSSSVTEEPQAKAAETTGTSDPTPTSSSKPLDVIDLSWLAPTPENIQKINQPLSKIFDLLGMNIEIRANSEVPKPAQTQTAADNKVDKTTETANTPTMSTPSQTPPGGAGTSSKSTEMDPVAELEKKLVAVLMAEPKLKKKSDAALVTSDDEDFSSSLSDDDTSADAAVSLEKRWTLVDIPTDTDEPQNKSKPVNDETKEISSPKVVASTSSMPATPNATTAGNYPEAGSVSSTSNGSTSKAIDYEQLGKALKQHLEAEQQAEAQKPTPASPQPTSAPKEGTPSPVPTLAAQHVQATPNVHTVYSHKPHVNHAVHAMMAMGFSNEGAWLTQLLDSVNGDIPRALDLLTPHRMHQ